VRVGLIADTHIPGDVKAMPPHVKEAFKKVDLILHAGDIYTRSVLDELESIAPVLAARGNGDWDFPQDRRLKDNHTLDLAGVSLGITHGLDYPRSPEYYDAAMKREFGKRVDVLVCGDTHTAMVETFNGICLVNPGSPTLPNNLYELGTVGLLEITENRFEARIVHLSEFSLPFHRELVYY
jgi:putative phosphoesterase